MNDTAATPANNTQVTTNADGSFTVRQDGRIIGAIVPRNDSEKCHYGFRINDRIQYATADR